MSDVNPDRNRDTFRGRGARIKELEGQVEQLKQKLLESEQTKGLLCDKCGWSMKFPDEPCRCELEDQVDQLKQKLAEGSMKKWRVGGCITASTYVGEVEAATWQEAVDKAYEVAGVSVCYECAKHISDPEIDHLWAEDVETGDCWSELTLSDQVSEQAREIERLRQTMKSEE